MIKELFFVKGNQRMNIVKDFIRKNMKTARFIQNPYYYEHKDEFSVYISYDIEDINKLNDLLNEFYEIDNPKITSKENWFFRLLDKFI